VTVDPLSAAQETRALIARCLSGEADAAKEFQQHYGELIYSYPIRVYRTPPEDAGDFYVFAFERGRIFRRMRTFEGRTTLHAYLSGFVLDNLVLEWKRGERGIETVSIEALGEVPDSAAIGYADAHPSGQPSLAEMLARLEGSKAVLLKLLYVEDSDLTVADVRYIAKISRRRMSEVLAGVDGLRSTVREREAHLKRAEDALDSVHAWIQLYQRRMRRICDDLSNLPPGSTAAVRLREEHAELERKLQRRHQQRTALLGRAQRRKVTAPYKDIAALLNTSVGNVASQILRVRRELAAKVELPEDMEMGGHDD